MAQRPTPIVVSGSTPFNSTQRARSVRANLSPLVSMLLQKKAEEKQRADLIKALSTKQNIPGFPQYENPFPAPPPSPGYENPQPIKEARQGFLEAALSNSGGGGGGSTGAGVSEGTTLSDGGFASLQGSEGLLAAKLAGEKTAPASGGVFDTSVMMPPDEQTIAGFETLQKLSPDVAAKTLANYMFPKNTQENLVGTVSPEKFTPESLQNFAKTGDYTKLVLIKPETEIPYSKPDPKDYTQESFNEYLRTGNAGVLVSREKPEQAKSKLVTIKNSNTGQTKLIEMGAGSEVPGGWEIYESPFTVVVPTGEGLKAINARNPQAGMTDLGVGKPLPEAEITGIRNFGVLRDQLNEVKKSYKPDYVGPVDSLKGTFGEYVTDNLSEEQAQFYQKLATIRNTILYMRSGAQINEHEEKRLLNELPVRYLRDKTFQSRLKGFESYLNSITRNREEALKQGGYKPAKSGSKKDLKSLSNEELLKLLGE